jgi:hypothetical protein
MTKSRTLADAGTAFTSVSATELAFVDGVTSAIQTQVDAKTAKATLTTTGDIYYASSASTPARLGIGSSTQVLTVAGGVPTWASPTSGGMTLLSTTTLSGATTTISSIDQTYKSLYLVMYGVTNATGNGQFKLSPNNSATISDWVMQALSNTVINTDREAAGQIYFNYTSNTTDRIDANNVWTMRIDNYASTTNYKVFNMSAFYIGISGRVNHQTQGGIRTNTAISSLVFTNAAGNFSTGTVELYGVK